MAMTVQHARIGRWRLGRKLAAGSSALAPTAAIPFRKFRRDGEPNVIWLSPGSIMSSLPLSIEVLIEV